MLMPADWALGTWVGLVGGLLVGLLNSLTGGLVLDLAEAAPGGGTGGAGRANTTAFLTTGDEAGSSVGAGRGLPGSLALAPETFSCILGCRDGGPPDLIILVCFTGTLTGGI